jgi:hypothetical protein
VKLRLPPPAWLEFYPGDCEQTPRRRIVDGGFCNRAVQDGEVLTEAA